MLNVSVRAVTGAGAVQDKATPALIQAVDRGAIAVSVAAGLAAASEAIQREAVAEPKRAHLLVKQAMRETCESELAAKQLALPARRYGVLYVDYLRDSSHGPEKGMDRAADNHYPTPPLAEILAIDIAAIAADDSVLFLWATAPLLPQALGVMKAWGFEYKTEWIWGKDRAGTGYWLRNRHESLLIGVKGNVPAPALGTQPESLIEAAVHEHSRKPETFAEKIEAMFPHLPKIELFARGEARPGWDAWGNEAE